ncbi:MAG TPA: adenylyltransferase/cytidyltransferase family protein [Candidatus Dormibacteraeota bacterium]|jgi:rfaE bifunctional protein nucleotidyltransferase chain/domain|nr:adenylyltransferase/cytidyltransferase family protein [Candidatus Dormibacteraeota bacterium]
MSGRVVGLAELDSELARAREEGKRVVLTNGCFDLLHPGHLSYLRRAREQGDLLVVGVNSDDSVRVLKGPGRPLVAEADRAGLLAALDPVDLVVIFPELRADELLRAVRPDVYVKGGDYSPETLPEAPTAAELGADIRLLSFVPGYSTSGLIKRIRDGEGG